MTHDMENSLLAVHPAIFPSQRRIIGRSVMIEMMDDSHIEDLYSCVGGSENAVLWQYMPGGPFDDMDSFKAYFTGLLSPKDSVFYALLDPISRKPFGYLGLLNIRLKDRVVEIGSVMLSPKLKRSTAATEAFYLMAKLVFDDLGFRRYEWKCNDLNTASKAAAIRLGFKFEGVFRQHMIVKGQNRDSTWFSMLDSEWPAVKSGFEKWLDVENFDAQGYQRKSLASFR